MGRTYTLKKRAAAQAETRLRIVDAAVELHGTLGPAHTSVSAIAKRAGVQRATVYDHFPDEPALAQACTTHYFERHPPPDPAAWQAVEGPLERLRLALTEVYAYHRRVEPMMTRVHRDAELKPLVWETEAAQAHGRHWERIAGVLLAPWAGDGGAPRLLVAAIGHALHFETWRLLVRQHALDDAEAVTIMVGLARCASGGGS